MPFSIDPHKNCKNCPYGMCITYIREQSKRMKDRDTQYRLAQKISMACTYESGIPGFCKNNLDSTPLSDLVNKCISNGKLAGKFIEEFIPEHFGSNVEASFSLTSGQIGKVRGDIFEMLSRAILWNTSVLHSGTHRNLCSKELASKFNKSITGEKYAAITLGDNYDLKKLFNDEASREFSKFEEKLNSKGTSFCYSTPDLIVIKCNESIWPTFSKPITDLSIENQHMLSTVKNEIEGKISPEDIVLAAGIKTSIRSDRMYQLLFEANAWKAIWREIYSLKPSKYFSLIGQSYGVDPVKLNSVEFTNLSCESEINKAIDGLVHISTPIDLIDWYSGSIS